jgi:fatty acid desaturase
MTSITATTPESSGVSLDRKALKQLSRRSDRPGLITLGLWALLLAGSGALLFFSLGTWGVVPATILYGSILTVPAYALSHECAHGTAFRTRWLNELVFWVTSFIFFEGPHFRRYAHARHQGVGPGTVRLRRRAHGAERPRPLRCGGDRFRAGERAA